MWPQGPVFEVPQRSLCVVPIQLHSPCAAAHRSDDGAVRCAMLSLHPLHARRWPWRASFPEMCGLPCYYLLDTERQHFTYHVDLVVLVYLAGDLGYDGLFLSYEALHRCALLLLDGEELGIEGRNTRK